MWKPLLDIVTTTANVVYVAFPLSSASRSRKAPSFILPNYSGSFRISFRHRRANTGIRITAAAGTRPPGALRDEAAGPRAGAPRRPAPHLPGRGGHCLHARRGGFARTPARSVCRAPTRSTASNHASHQDRTPPPHSTSPARSGPPGQTVRTAIYPKAGRWSSPQRGGTGRSMPRGEVAGHHQERCCLIQEKKYNTST